MRRVGWVAGLGVVVLMALLRVISLESDAYLRLSWSSGLLTDEGFYIHNARNLVLFGTERTDEFNNALLMPTLHAVQVWVFRRFGVGIVQARSISVAASLLGLVLFYFALKRAFGGRVAAVGTLFLGLDHVSLLYHRMALMDTPASLVLIAAFWAFVYAFPKQTAHGQGGEGIRDDGFVSNGLKPIAVRPAAQYPSDTNAGIIIRVLFGGLFLCGVLLGVAYATRSLALLLFPVPLLALWGQRRGLIAVYGGLVISLAVYAVCWYLPNREEMARVSGYYLNHQLLPHGLVDVKNNVGTAFFDVRLGMFPYLLMHTPVVFVLAVSMLARSGWLVGGKPVTDHQSPISDHPCARYLRFWLLIPLVVFCFVSYAPSRYYVLFYPAMAGLAALGVERLWRLHEAEGIHEGTRRQYAGRFAIVVGLWAVINGAWLGDWLTHLRYTQRNADRWLANHLPAGSVLIGDAAPGVCLNNRFKAVSVIIGLCNDKMPVEAFAPAPRYIVILTGRRYLAWWRERYPEVITPANKIILPYPHLVGFNIAVYRVPPSPFPIAE